MNLPIESQKRAEKFVQEVKEDGLLFYVLKDDGSAEISASHHFESEDNQPSVVIPFWSKSLLPYARQWAEDAEIEELSIEDFIEFWLPGMHHDQVIVGLNWDQNGIGYECQPMELADRLID